MKKSFKTTMLGVTLLEIMLVLAIAGVIIAMSIRYFQSAAMNQRVTSGLSAIQAVVGGVEAYRMAGQPMTTAGLTNDNVKLYMPNSTMPLSPWDNTVLTVAFVSTSSYTITMAVPTVPPTGALSACTQLSQKLTAASTGYASSCGTAGFIVITVSAA